MSVQHLFPHQRNELDVQIQNIAVVVVSRALRNARRARYVGEPDLVQVAMRQEHPRGGEQALAAHDARRAK
jgi:hypothetical protein